MVPNETLLEILAFLKLFELDGVLMASGSVSKAALECAGQLSRSDCQTVVLLTDGAVVHLDRTGATIKRVYVPNGIYVEQLKLLIQNSVIADNCVAVDCDCGRAELNVHCMGKALVACADTLIICGVLRLNAPCFENAQEIIDSLSRFKRLK
ncbi:hypothetical protein AAVH_37839, partial [Aphelenchoides avenae]